MENRYFKISNHEKRNVLDSLKSCLEPKPAVIFAYLHGSFLTEDRFKDIDIAVYLDPLPPSPFQAEIGLEIDLGNAVRKYPIDVRVLNHASLSFKYNVIKQGQSLLVRDDDFRSGFIETTLSYYFDFSPFRREYLREALHLGI